MLDLRELAKRLFTKHPWRTLGAAVAAGAVLALLPSRVVRGVVKSTALAFARDAASTYFGGAGAGAERSVLVS